MAETVNDSLSVTPAASEVPTIVLDGDGAAVTLTAASGEVGAVLAASGNLTLGGPAGDGDLYVKDSAGVTRVELDAANQLLRLRNAAGQEVGLMGPGADLRLGGNGASADLELRDAAGQVRVALAGGSHRLRLFAADGSAVAELGPNGNLSLGGPGGGDGDLYLRDTAQVIRIELDAGNQLIRFRNAAGQEVGRLGDNANLRLGGNGSDGDIVLSDAEGTVRIELDATRHVLRFRNASGQEVGNLGPNANLTLGGNGSDGDVDLYDTNGRRRLLMSAEGNSLSAWDAAGNRTFEFGGNSNIRMGGHGTDGDILLYPSGANDIFSDGDATIHLDANAGDITLRNADCAEEFEVLPWVAAEPGTVMALGEGGALRPTRQAHERAVVGVVSGAGSYKPGIVLDRQPGQGHRRPIALMGKTWVKVTDEGGPIAIGDLLTSAGTEGHAMRAGDPARCFGAVIGKAIAPHAAGSGLIPMLIALQ